MLFKISECSVNAYKNGQYLQILKLMNFHKRCVFSVYSIASDVLNCSLSSCFAAVSDEVIIKTLLGDNFQIGKPFFIY